MVIKCISEKPNELQAKYLPKMYRRADFHISSGTEYVVLGISFMLDDSVGRCSFVEITSDYGHLSSVPLFLFEIVDPRVSKYWTLRQFDPFTFALWPNDFYTEYFHDDLSNNLMDAVERFNKIKAKLEEETKNGNVSD
jgi:hypothetical protein